jgi:hypothetical protein
VLVLEDDPVTVGENREVFWHVAYEAYEELLGEAARLLAEEEPLLDSRARARWLALHEQSYYRGLTPMNIVAERSAVLSALQRLGVDAPSLPDAVPHRTWRWILRQIERTKKLKALAAPDFVVDDGLNRLRETMTTVTRPPEPYEIHPCTWPSEAEFVFDTVSMVLVNGDEIGVGRMVNRLPEASAFRTRYPSAYSFWDIHSQPVDAEDANKPEPERYPGAIWTAKGVTLPSQFAPGYQPPLGGGPVTYGTSSQLAEWVAGEYPPTVADFVRACRSASNHGRAVVSMIEVQE